MKNVALKLSFLTSLVIMILCGAYASDTMHPIFVTISLICGLYVVAFTFINKDRWIFKQEEDYYEN